MTTKLTVLLALLALPFATACVPVALGVGGAIVADEIVEQEQGGDGLF